MKFLKSITKVFALVLSFCVTFNSLNVLAKAQSINSDAEVVRQELRSRGVPEGMIERYPEDVLISMDIDKISVDSKYYQVPNDESKEPIEISEHQFFFRTEAAKSSSDEQLSNDGYLNQTIVVSYNSNADDYLISYYASWKTNPYNRKADAFGVAISNATVRSDKQVYAEYCYTRPLQTKPDVIDLSRTISRFPHGVGAVVDLRNIGFILLDCRDMSVFSMFYAVHDNPSVNHIGVAGFYKHQEKVLQSDISISMISMEVGLSISGTTNMVDMNPNPYVTYYR